MIAKQSLAIVLLYYKIDHLSQGVTQNGMKISLMYANDPQ
jgi:hypothetical protein